MAEWPTAEEDLRAPVRGYLEAQGYSVRDEVWINGRIADLFAFTEEDTLAVELKLTDWRKATVQAMAYQLGALYTYIALPLIHVPKVMRQSSTLRSRNVGLLAVAPPEGPGFQRADGLEDHAPGQPRVRELLEPGPSQRYLPFLADKIVRDAKRPKRVWTAMPRDF